jgi:hypothetical protein
MLNTAMIEGTREWGLRLWACRVRREIPGRHVQIPDRRIADLFAACDTPQPVRPFIEERAKRERAVDAAFSEGNSQLGPQFVVAPPKQHKPESDSCG